MHRKSANLVAFAALSVLCGIGAHLVAELASLGAVADARLIFSARHVPLGLLALAALVALAVAARQRKMAACLCGRRLCRCASRLLPLAFVAQFAVCATTQLGEGTPIEAGDVTVGVVAALLAGALGALVIVFAQRRLIGALAELFTIILAGTAPAKSAAWQRAAARVWLRRSRPLTFAGSRRPPPVAPVIDHVITLCRLQEQFGVYNDHRAVARAWRIGAEPGARPRLAASC